MNAASTLFEKMWASHVVRDLGGGRAVIHIDRHVVHEGTSLEAFAAMRDAGQRVRNPDLTVAVIDHVVSTAPDRDWSNIAFGRFKIDAMVKNCREHGIPLFDIKDPRQGIAHVIAPEQGIVLPGMTLVCGDSHTATCGGVGAYAWGIGATEVYHVLVGQALVVRKPKTMRVSFEGRLGPGVYAKDLILHLIGRHGLSAGTGYAIEYAGSAIRAMSVEERMTVCNMSIEFGARTGFVAPDDTTLAYVAARPLAPKGAAWDRAVASWRGLRTDPDAAFDREITVDCATLGPQVTWGTSPQCVMNIDGRIPDSAAPPPHETAESVRRSLAYMGLTGGRPIAGTPIDFAFLGSCTNSRLIDLELAAKVVRGRKVKDAVRALVVPGSMQVKQAAEAMGLDKVFTEAGFEWRSSSCSMCVAANGDVVPAGARCISSSNRNFENRQGPGSRTHLASPAMVAAAAIEGCITDVRRLLP